MAGGYNDGYRSCPCFWGRAPGRLITRLVEIVDSFDGFHILDAGCGEGKNAVYLAGLGAKVQAIDISPYALANARQAWVNTGTTCRFELADIQKVKLPASFFDVVIAYGLLHCLASEIAIRDTIKRLQNCTKEGGYNVIVAFNSRNQDLSAHPELKPCLLDHNDYVRMYRRWQIIENSDEDLHETHPNNNLKHVHSMTRLLAAKKSANVHPASTPKII